MNCPYCPNVISDASKYCPKCGHLIVRCPSCNKVINYKAQFCSVDGTKIDPELTADLPPYVPEKKEKQFKKITVSSTTNSHFCKKCGKVCNEGQTLCDNCSKPQRKSPIPLILIAILIIALLAGGTVAIAKFVDFSSVGQEANAGIVSSSEDINAASDDEIIDDTAPEKEAEISELEKTSKPEEDEKTGDKSESIVEESSEMDKSAFEVANRYSDNVVTLDGHAYAIFNFKDEGYSSYDECAEFCERMGGYLAVIESAAENDFLFQFVQDSGLHLAFFGYTDQEEEGCWKWERETSTYTNWDVGQPNNGAKNKNKKAENYAEFSKSAADGTWNDAPFGSNTYHFICEWE
jgi:hypothetical protein